MKVTVIEITHSQLKKMINFDDVTKENIERT